MSGSGYVVTGKFLTANANTFTVTFPVPENPGSDNIAWVEDQNGDIIYLKVSLPPRPHTLNGRAAFPLHPRHPRAPTGRRAVDRSN